MVKFFILYLIIINFYGIYIMYSDKRRAKKGSFRIPEKKLFIIALLLGNLGIIVGMEIFRHKTKHYKFVYGMPAIFFIQVYLIYKFFF